MADWAEKNRAHFDESASTYNIKFSKVVLQIIEEIQERREWVGVDWIDEDESASQSQKTVRLLDYACGTGTVSRALAPFISQAVGIDVSSSMVQEYNTAASNQGIPESEMHAVVGNLIDASTSSPPDPSLSVPELYGFDIAAVGMGWHHFADPGFAAKQLCQRLKIGGTLLIIDFLPHERSEHSQSHDHHHHHKHGEAKEHGAGESEKDGKDGKAKDTSAAHTVMHFGFSQEDCKRMFEEAGVGVDFDFVVVGKGIVFEHDGKTARRTVFMAKGRKG